MKKLIRHKLAKKHEGGDRLEVITNMKKLNKLYALKIKEESLEVQESGHKDIFEFADLLQVAFDWATINGISEDDLFNAVQSKMEERGRFTNITLKINNKKPHNVKIYGKKTK